MTDVHDNLHKINTLQFCQKSSWIGFSLSFLFLFQPSVYQTNIKPSHKMHSSHIHSSYQQHSHIKTVTHHPAEHVSQISHTRIVSHFFLPASLGSTPVDSPGLMRLKISKTASAANAGPFNKLKTIPHSLYDDPAFSADPNVNPLCSSSYDISSWVVDPPKGHPSINSRRTHTNAQNNNEVTLIQPPNSPVYLIAQPQPFKSKPMTPPATSLVVSPPSTSLPDLSSTSVSASDSSLPTPATPSGSRLSLTDMPSAAVNNKRRIDFPFFKRKSLPEPAAGSHPINVSMSSSTAVQLKRLGSSLNGAIDSAKTAGHETKYSQAPRAYRPAGMAQGLDMIDELDESNPLGIALHHGGPYEAIRKMVDPRGYAHQAPYNPNQQQFRFDMPLNLSPGQVLPHSVTPHYRPRAPLGLVSNVQERVDFGVQVRSPAVTNRTMGPATNQSSMNHPPVNSVHNGLINHSSSYGPPHNAAPRPPPRHTLPEQTLLNNSKFKSPNVYHSAVRVAPPAAGSSHSSVASNEPTVGVAGYGLTNKEHMAQHIDPKQEQHAYENGDPSNQYVNRPGNDQVPHETLSDRREAEECSRGRSHGSQRYPPAQPEHVLPPGIQDQSKPQELSSGPIPNRHVNETYPSSSSSFQSGASSVKTETTVATSVSFRNRILPKQLVMPSPLAKAAVSPRLQPTHLPQNVQRRQNLPRQHRIRFHDGTEYELPVTNSNPGHVVEVLASPEASHRPIEPPTLINSIPQNGKLKKRPSLRGPEPPEIVAQLAATPKTAQKSKYMEPPPTIPEHPQLDYKPTTKVPMKQGMRRLLTKRRSALRDE
ncbi:hypothetical protein AX15_001579 [Amanita polypyramis BW_CC]|nr:hypothetical protein AX15_001579 [Amanita polypyramis BW_CC]